MAGLDLSGVAAALNDWLVDTLTITRDGRPDAVLNPATGVLEQPPAELVWSGLGAVQVIGRAQLDDPETADVVRRLSATHRALVPLTADTGALPGDRLSVTAQGATSHDPQLTADTFRLEEVGGSSTFAVVRFLYLTAAG